MNRSSNRKRYPLDTFQIFVKVDGASKSIFFVSMNDIHDKDFDKSSLTSLTYRAETFKFIL